MLRNGQTNSGSFKPGIIPWNTGLKGSSYACRIKTTRICRRCGAEFRLKSPAQRYCGDLCKVKKCDICNIAFVPSNKGQQLCSIKCNAASMSIRRRGPSNPAYRGANISATNRERRSAKYRAWRTSVFMRDNYTCQLCNKHGGYLEADHIKPFSTHPESRYDITNGRTLCKTCHRATPTYGTKIFKYVAH